MFLRAVSVATFLACAAYVAPLLLGKLLANRSRKRLRQSASRLVKVAPGVELNVTVKGQGSPTVIFDAGLGMSSLSWHWIQSLVSEHTCTVSFDRPGLGCSPPVQGPWLRRVDLMVEWMHALVKELGLKGDLILVGHSTSGMHARLFCHLHPEMVKGLVLIDTAHEQQLGKLEGSSVYNSYPDAAATEAKLARLRSISSSGLLRALYLFTSPTFYRACQLFPPLALLHRPLDLLGRPAALGQRRNIDILGPHFPPALRRRFEDEQLEADGMEAMIAEHGSQRATMEYMQALDLMRPGALGDRPVAVVSRDPAKGAGGRLYPGARGDPAREPQHQAFQREQARLSAAGGVQLQVRGAGHGSLLFARVDARQAALAALDVVAAARGGAPLPEVCRRRLLCPDADAAAADAAAAGPGGGPSGTVMVWPED